MASKKLEPSQMLLGDLGDEEEEELRRREILDEDEEDNFDAFNDDTFGMGAEEWQEEDARNLAELTEEERKAKEQSNAFFDFDENDPGEALEEEGEESLLEATPVNGKDEALLSMDGLRISEKPLQQPQHQHQQQHSQNVQVGVSQQQQQLQHPGPPPASMLPPPMMQQQQPHALPADDPAILNVVRMPLMPEPPRPYMVHPHQQQPHQQPPAQFPPHPGGPPGDPAIMSIGKLPPGGGPLPPPPPTHYVIHQQGPHPPHLIPHPHPGGFPPHLGPPPPGVFAPPPMPRPPPTVGGGGHKTLQQLEHEMMQQTQFRGNSAPFPPVPHQPPPQHHHHQQQQQMRRPPHQHHHQHGSPQHRGYHQHGHHQHHHNNGNGPYQQQRGHHHHHHHGGHHHHNNNRNNFDDKNRETFGDDLVDEQQRESRDRHHQQRRQQHQPYERQYSRDPARRDLMPGHVHALGILRDARERQERQYESTGNPQLDLELEKREQEEAELRKQYDSASQNPEDEFAGLMTPRERQWIINIQLQQLKCENPFIDDYYYTVYNQKREMREQDAEAALEDEGPQLKRTEEGPQLLLKPDSSRDARYLPTQFTNSLGKLQAVTVKAPRKIIDVSVVNNDLIEGSTSAQKETRNKNTLMELERLYTTLIDVEDCEKKIAALPTGTPLRKQVEEERVTALNTLVASLNVENKIKRYLLVRKGKVLLKRCLRVLDDTSVQLFTSSLFQLLPKALKRDREDQIVPKYLEDLKPHIQGANLELILHYFKLLNAGTAGGGNSPSPKISFATFKLTVTNGFGVSVILLLMKYLLEMWESLSSTEEKEAKKLLNELASAIADAGDSVAQPLEPVKVDIDQLVMDSKELRKLAAIGGADRS